MAKELAKQYDPKNVEDRIYKTWLDGKYFHAEVDEKKNLIQSALKYVETANNHR